MLLFKKAIYGFLLTVLVISSGVIFSQSTDSEKARYRTALEENRVSMNDDENEDRYLAKFNVAQCLFALDSLHSASALYLNVSQKVPHELRSVCFNHLGIIEVKLNNQKTALEYFKTALIADLNNEKAKYNYELLRKRIEKENPPPPPPTNQPPPPSVGLGKASPIPTEQLGINWTFEPMSREQALLLLEQQRMRPEKYLQQLRKSFVRDKRYSSEPQW